MTPGDALVRPFIASRCDGDVLPIHRPVSRAMQLGLRTGLIDPVVASIVGRVPFRGPFGIGHECVAQVTAVGQDVKHFRVGDVMVVPWAVSCGECRHCRLGLTAKCVTTTTATPGGTLSAFGFGAMTGDWGGMVADSLRVPFADHMLVRVPNTLDPLRIAAAGDNLSDAWRAVVPALRGRPEGAVIVIGGGAQSIGLYAAGLAVGHGASVVDYFDDNAERLDIAQRLGARVHRLSTKHRSLGSPVRRHYDVAVEASSRPDGLASALRALRPGGVCTGTGYYLAPGTKIPAMEMYATSASLHIGVSHVRPVLPELLDFLVTSDFPAELVTTRLADWEEAPAAYASRSVKVVLHRPRLAQLESPGTGRSADP